MVWQLADQEHKAKRISDWRVGGRVSLPTAISASPPTAHERHGRGERTTNALRHRLIFGYLNCRSSNIVLKYSTEGGILY